MKRPLITLLLSISLLQFSYSQNTFPGTGNVGIGTTSPATTLDVNGAGNFSAGLITGSSANNTNIFQKEFVNQYYGISGVSYPGQFRWYASPNNSLYYNNALFQLRAWDVGSNNENTILTFTGGGNVGIGTTSPSFPLSISTGLSGDAMRITNTSSGNAVIEYFTSDGSQTYMGQVPGSWGGLTNSPSVYESNRTICITPVLNTPQSGINLLTNGNVLIGQISQVNSAYKLDVAGNVRANQITVNATGADFVFNPSYHLNSLSFLKKYIDQNHHLPEISSAKQMQTEGLNVGDNQIKLLQKVEELTLYLIEKDKEVKEQKEALKTQQDEINLLKQQVQLLLKNSNKN